MGLTPSYGTGRLASMGSSAPTTRYPRRSFNRPMIVRFKWAKDRRCQRHGHVLDAKYAQRQISGVLWPICTRCGFAIEPDHPNPDSRDILRAVGGIPPA